MTKTRRARDPLKGKGTRKERKSFTLSPESISLLKELQDTRGDLQRRSASAVLDELLRSLRKERRRQSVERTVTRYYGSLSDEEHAEDSQWGEFAWTQFPDQDA
jgi:hypothetical protein